MKSYRLTKRRSMMQNTIVRSTWKQQQEESMNERKGNFPAVIKQPPVGSHYNADYIRDILEARERLKQSRDYDKWCAKNFVRAWGNMAGVRRLSQAFKEVDNKKRNSFDKVDFRKLVTTTKNLQSLKKSNVPILVITKSDASQKVSVTSQNMAEVSADSVSPSASSSTTTTTPNTAAAPPSPKPSFAGLKRAVKASGSNAAKQTAEKDGGGSAGGKTGTGLSGSGGLSALRGVASLTSAAKNASNKKTSVDNSLKKKIMIRTPESTSLAKRLISGAKKELEDEEPEEETDGGEELSLQNQLVPALSEVSRQKLRSLRMMLRRTATTSDQGRLSSKDVQNIFTELKINLPYRVFQMLLKECENKYGIDYEKLLTFLTRAHQFSGRDSVEALQTDEMDMSDQAHVAEQDAELMKRAEEQMSRAREAFSIEDLKKDLKAKDIERKGILPKSLIVEKCTEHNCPVYGALLTTLLKRSDQSNDGMISWPEFVNFLEKVQKDTLVKYPELAKLQKRVVKIVKPVMTREIMVDKLKDVAAKAIAIEKQRNADAAAGIIRDPSPPIEKEKEASPKAGEHKESRPTSSRSTTASRPTTAKGKPDVKENKKSLAKFGAATKTSAKLGLKKNSAKQILKNNAQQNEAKVEEKAEVKQEAAIQPVQTPPQENPNKLKISIKGVEKHMWLSDVTRKMGTNSQATDLPTESLELQ